MKLKKLLIILSAGRCGSTNLINKLNQEDEINIYGENFGALLDLIKSASNFHKYNSIVSGQTKTRFILNNSNSTLPSINLEKQIKKVTPYIGNEFYNNPQIVKHTLDSLNNSIINFFEGKSNIVGFKEIRFHLYDNLNYFKYLTQLPFHSVKFIHLTRNTEEQALSMFNAFNPNEEENPSSFSECIQRIEDCNNNINKFLSSIGKNSKYKCNYTENSELHYKNILKWLKG